MFDQIVFEMIFSLIYWMSFFEFLKRYFIFISLVKGAPLALEHHLGVCHSLAGHRDECWTFLDASRSLFLSDECPNLHLGFIFAIVLCHPAAARQLRFISMRPDPQRWFVAFAEEEDCCCLKDALWLENPSFDLTVDFLPWSCCIVNLAVYFQWKTKRFLVGIS